MKPMLPRLCLAALLATPVAAGAAGVADALDRPAIGVRHPQRSVLLASAQAGNRIVAVGERGVIVLSDDGGRQWRQAPAPVGVTLTSVRFADPRTGYAVGHAGCVLATRDGGDTWATVLDGRRVARLYLDGATQRSDAKEITAAERLVADGPDKPLLDVLVVDAARIIVVGAYGLALETRDGGRSWTPIGSRLANPKGLHLYAIRAQGSRIVIAGEQGLVLKSDDAGATFEPLTTPYKGSFFTLELPTPSGIVLAGLRGNVWTSPDNGARWHQVTSPMNVSVTGSAVDEAGSVYLANQAGFVLRLDDDRLRPVNATAVAPLTAVLPLTKARLLSLSMQGPVEMSTSAADAGSGAK